MHYMLDLETLGTDPETAPIVQISVVPFDPLGGGPYVNEEPFNMKVDAGSQVKFGRIIDYDTLKWWLGEDAELLTHLVSDPSAVHLAEALSELSLWFYDKAHKHQVGGIWANGPTFDVSMLEAAFRQTGIECPWKFWTHRCVRTVRGLIRPDQEQMIYEGGLKTKIETNGKKHDALVDCMRQIRWVQNVYRVMNLG